MQRLLVFLLFIGLSSCNYFNVKKTSSETILNEELKTFNWNQVDEYPSFSSCDSITDKSKKKLCFEKTLTTAIYTSLSKENLSVTQDINDTILIQFQISETGKLSIIDVKIDSLTVSEIPEIKDFISQSLNTLPRIHPAIKRGQQVKTEFKLPIVIQAN